MDPPHGKDKEESGLNLQFMAFLMTADKDSDSDKEDAGVNQKKKKNKGNKPSQKKPEAPCGSMPVKLRVPSSAMPSNRVLEGFRGVVSWSYKGAMWVSERLTVGFYKVLHRLCMCVALFRFRQGFARLLQLLLGFYITVLYIRRGLT